MGHSLLQSHCLTMKLLLAVTALLGIMPGLNAICAIQGCDKYYESIKSDTKITGACAVLFKEDCCKVKGTFGDTKKHLVIPKGGEGKLCGTSKTVANAAAAVVGFGSASSCTGPNLKDEVKSLIVMPGCTLEVWDKDTSIQRKGSLWYAKEQESKSVNAGLIRDVVDKYDRNKISITAVKTPNWVEQLDDDFDDMEEDIETYRCTC